MKLPLFILLLALCGCGTFGLKNIRQSEASLEYAKQVFARFNYKNLLSQMNPRQADIKSIGPVRLYSATSGPFSIEQVGWNYIQSLHLTNRNECYAYIHILRDSEEAFKHDAGSLYCFQDDKSFVKLPL